MNKDRKHNGVAGATCDRIYGLLGLAARKRSIVSGGGQCEREIERCPVLTGGELTLLIANDASENTFRKFSKAASRKGMEYRVFGTCAGLGARTGKSGRSVMIVTDRSLSLAVRTLIDGDGGKCGGQ
jgi:ribosomal protein L7Ae-like RNA K-turn-binding protein